MARDVAIFNDLEAAGRDAGRRLARAAQPSLFDRLDWFALVQELTPEGQPLVIRARTEAASCWLFLSRRGRSAEALGNWYSLRFGPVVDGSSSGAPIGDLSIGLRRAGISHLFLQPAADDRLVRALRRRGWAAVRGPVNVSWRVETRGMTFEDYWASRPARLRNTAARRARKAALDIVIHDRFDAGAWADYESVFAASWKPAEGSAALIRRLAEQEGGAGTLRLGLAYRDGQAVAAQLWLVENGIATIHKLAYREDARDFSPGTVLSVEMFRRAIDVDRVDLIDFGIGDDGYKADWMSHKVTLYGITAYDLLRPAGLAGILRSIAGKLALRLANPGAGPGPGPGPARPGGEAGPAVQPA